MEATCPVSSCRERWSRVAALLILLAALPGEAQTIADTFRRTGPHEALIVPFTVPSVATSNSYVGDVEIIVSGMGTSYGDLVNDAFYGVPSGIPVDYYGYGITFDISHYQLNIGWGEDFGLAGCEGELNNLNNFITFIEAVGDVSPPAMPAYDPIENTYHFVVSTGADAEPLAFGVSDCHFEDNTGTYNIEVFQLESTPGPSRTPRPSPTPSVSPPTPGVVPFGGVVVGAVAGKLGQTVQVTVSLDGTDQPVAALQADIAFEPDLPIAASENGRPLCGINQGINKPDSNFSFQPPGCVPGVDCESVRAVIVAFDNVQAIPDGAALFSCAVEIAPTTVPRTYALECESARGSDATAAAVDVRCTSGAVTVIPPDAIVVGSGSGRPLESLRVPVFLASATDEVVAAQVDVLFDSNVSIASRSNGLPDCRVNSEINKPGARFSFQPLGCLVGVTCSSVRALVLDFTDLTNLDPIADGSMLFDCAVEIAGDSPPGRYALGCSGALGSDARGTRVDLACIAGAITVSRVCAGDCDGDGRVTVDELVVGVGHVLGTLPLQQCQAFDANFSGEVTIEELLRGVLGALNGCG